jgi:hypothetical protein
VFYLIPDSYHLNDEKGWLYCLDVTTGNLIWDKLLTQEGALVSSPAIADGKIYINSMAYFHLHGYLYCLDAMTGDSIWQYWLYQTIYSSPAIADGRVFLVSQGSFYTFDDSAPSDNPPIVTITGPHMGFPGNEYNYTLLVEDPEGHDVFVIFELLNESPWPSGYWWEAPSGELEVLTIQFKEEGSYLIRVRAQDTEYYTWSNWTILTVNISEPKQLFLFGLINHVEKESSYTVMNATFVFYMQFFPFKVGFLSSGDQIITLNNSTGHVGSRFIIGRFQAAVG